MWHRHDGLENEMLVLMATNFSWCVPGSAAKAPGAVAGFRLHLRTQLTNRRPALWHCIRNERVILEKTLRDCCSRRIRARVCRISGHGVARLQHNFLPRNPLPSHSHSCLVREKLGADEAEIAPPSGTASLSRDIQQRFNVVAPKYTCKALGLVAFNDQLLLIPVAPKEHGRLKIPKNSLQLLGEKKTQQ